MNSPINIGDNMRKHLFGNPCVFSENGTKYFFSDYDLEQAYLSTAALCMGKNSLEDTLDLMRNEFQRIIANPDSTPEIKGICVRAISEILVKVPIIEERDRLERKCAEQGLNLATLCDIVLGENAEKKDDKTLILAVRGILNEVEENKAKLSERKTVHQWLNEIGAEDTEANGKPMCLLRRLAVHLGIQPYSVK